MSENAVDDTKYGLLVSFPDQSPSFTYGFEAGEINCRMKLDEAVIDCGYDEGIPLREENLSLCHRLADLRGYTVEVKAVEQGWIPIRFTRQPRHKNSHLRVVKD